VEGAHRTKSQNEKILQGCLFGNARAMSWLSRLWPAARPAYAPVAAITVHKRLDAQSAEATEGALPDPPTPTPHLLPWLLNSAPLTELPLSGAEQAALAEIQRTLALKKLPDNLLPRASALVPQLIALLRQTELPLASITERVARDAALSAEVMRLASSPFYRAQGELSDLQQAITLIGAAGLQTVIARVVLRPIFHDASTGPSAGTAQRIWEHSQATARHAAALALPVGQPSLDAYLAGLLHNSGWKVAFHVLERAGIAIDAAPSQAFAQALTEHAHGLFGQAAQSWEITPGFTAFASDARANGLASSTHPLAPVLRAAQQHSMHETVGGLAASAQAARA
jgi:hypothetical protein